MLLVRLLAPGTRSRPPRIPVTNKWRWAPSSPMAPAAGWTLVGMPCRTTGAWSLSPRCTGPASIVATRVALINKDHPAGLSTKLAQTAIGGLRGSFN